MKNLMNVSKLKIAVIFAAAFLTMQSANASDGPFNFKKRYKDMRKQIIEQVTFPRTLTTTVGEQKVTVQFSFSTEGKLLLRSVRTSAPASKKLIEFVKEDFSKMNVELEKINPNAVYQLDVDYKLINQ